MTSKTTKGLADLHDGHPIVVARTLVADLDTPVSAYLKLSEGEDHACLLESIEGGEIRGRYSILGFDPDLIWTFDGHTVETRRSARTEDEVTTREACTDPLEALRALVNESLIDLPDHLPAMSAGLVGYMGYDLVHFIETVGDTSRPDPLDLPKGYFIRPRMMAVFDSVTNLVTLVTPVRPEPGYTPEFLLERAEERLNAAELRLDGPVPSGGAVPAVGADSADIKSNTSPQRYLEMVQSAKDYILAGDIFQVVLSQRFTRRFELPPFSLYRALRRTNPSPFMYHLKFGPLSIVGSSPEILVRLREGRVTIRPIAGTRPRGASPHEDLAHEQSLLEDPKELAEHLMLLDLGRNDVGRVARPGSVKVTARNTIERYSHVMHIVSNVEGDIADGEDALSAWGAGFPAGTVSGAPKVRAMQIIDELESDMRSVYAGSVGYFSADGSMDSAIVLRTALVKEGQMHVQAGAGIVADSDPKSEFDECVNKAKALFSAADEAVRFARSNRAEAGK